MILNCGRQEAEKHQDDHANDEGQQLTIFTDSAEFYIEYTGPEEANEALFTVHITHLMDQKPFPEGSVHLTLDPQDARISGTAAKAFAPGIWHVPVIPVPSDSFSIQLTYTGNSGRVFRAFRESIVLVSAERSSFQGEIRFSKEQAWKSDFAVEKVKPVPFRDVIRTGGEILAMPGEKYYIHARSPGMVNYVKKDLVAGADVIRGEEIMQIEGQGLMGENIAVEFAAAENRFKQSRSEYARHLNLFMNQALSEKEFIASRSAYLTDSIRYYNLHPSFDGRGLRITAPITGHIHQLMVSQGEYVEKGQLLATVSSDRRLLLRADVPQQYFRIIGNIVSANFRTSYQERVWDIDEFDGRLIAVGTSVLENNQYLPVYFEALNNGKLLEGAYAEFYLKTDLLEDCITVPVNAVLEEQGRNYVFIQTGGETFRKKQVTLLGSDGMRYHIDNSLSYGDRLVTRGVMLLKAASASSLIPSHNHEH